MVLNCTLISFSAVGEKLEKYVRGVGRYFNEGEEFSLIMSEYAGDVMTAKLHSIVRSLKLLL